MLLSPLLIRTLIYVIRTLSAIRGHGMVDSEAGELMREWEGRINEEEK